MATQLCKIDNYQLFTSTLKPIHSLELHFKPDMMDVHMLNSSGDVWTSVQYKTPVTSPCSICVDTNALTASKGEEVVISLDGNMLLLKSGKLTHKAPKLADPAITRKNKESIAVNWPHIIVELTPGDIKDIKSMIDNTSKYDFKLLNGVFSIIDISNDAVQFDMTVEGVDAELTYTSRFHGVNLEDVVLTNKLITGCKVLFGSKCPIEFVYASECMDVTYLLAPIIEQDE